ncbi:MAG: hypothetical protein ACRENP_27580 [Longimicrobiales bacterium]
MKRLGNVWTGICLATLTACSDGTPAGPGPRFALQPSVIASPSNSTNAIFSQIAKEIPGFGGFYIDNGAIHVYLVDPAYSSVAAQAVRSVLERRGRLQRMAELPIQIEQGAFSWQTLSQWYLSIRTLLSLPGVSMADIDERINRIVVGLTRMSAADLMREHVRSANIPLEAVTFVEEQLPALANHDLNHRVDPIPGGVSITRNSTNSPCTLSANAEISPTRYFLTASHCSNTWASLENTRWLQPTHGGDYVGDEVTDPPAFTAGCPGAACRYGDATLAEYNPISNLAWDFAKIAIPAGGAWRLFGPAAIGSRATIREKIIGGPFAGDSLDKVGRRTGWTYGAVDRTCVDHPAVAATRTVTMICSSRVQAGANNGDSGSPVFMILFDGTLGYYGVVFAEDQTTDEFPTRTWHKFLVQSNRQYRV